MIGDEAEAIAKSQRLMELGVMVIGFGFPVVPKGQARLRVQVSAAFRAGAFAASPRRVLQRPRSKPTTITRLFPPTAAET